MESPGGVFATAEASTAAGGADALLRGPEMLLEFPAFHSICLWNVHGIVMDLLRKCYGYFLCFCLLMELFMDFFERNFT